MKLPKGYIEVFRNKDIPAIAMDKWLPMNTDHRNECYTVSFVNGPRYPGWHKNHRYFIPRVLSTTIGKIFYSKGKP